jgi:hypothetical protein
MFAVRASAVSCGRHVAHDRAADVPSSGDALPAASGQCCDVPVELELDKRGGKRLRRQMRAFHECIEVAGIASECTDDGEVR